ncbi:hypothetical protein VPH35_128413 [Triticum aestivum]
MHGGDHTSQDSDAEIILSIVRLCHILAKHAVSECARCLARTCSGFQSCCFRLLIRIRIRCVEMMSPMPRLWPNARVFSARYTNICQFSIWYSVYLFSYFAQNIDTLLL